MWSKNPTPVRDLPLRGAVEVEARRVTSVSPVFRVSSALRLMASRFWRIRADIDSACTAKPSASAIGTPGARRARAAASPIRTSLIRRRKWPAFSAGGEARRAVGRQRVVRTRDVVAERRRARGADEQAARRGAPAARAPPRPSPDQLAGARARAPRRTRAPPRARARRRAPSGRRDRRAVAVERLHLAADRVEQRASSRDRDDERVVAVLGLGEQVERDQRAGRRPPRRARAGRTARRSRRSRRGPRPGAWPPGRRGCPGPTMTSTGRDRLGAVGERGDRLRAAHAVDLVDAAERAGGEDRRGAPARRRRPPRRRRRAR